MPKIGVFEFNYFCRHKTKAIKIEIIKHGNHLENSRIGFYLSIIIGIRPIRGWVFYRYRRAGKQTHYGLFQATFERTKVYFSYMLQNLLLWTELFTSRMSNVSERKTTLHVYNHQDHDMHHHAHKHAEHKK